MFARGRGVPDADPGSCRDHERFHREIALPARPVALRGAFQDWTAVRAAGSAEGLAAYLTRLATDVPTQAFVGTPEIGGRYYYAEGLEGFNFDRQDTDLRSAIDRILRNAISPGAETVYVGSLPSQVYLPGWADDNPAPIVPQTVQPRVWIGNASYVACHYDTYDNLAVVVAGERRFTLYPPEAVASLYVGPIDNTMAGPPVGLADGSVPGDPRYPAFEAIRDQALQVDLAPGDALYLPKLWWHRVEATAPFNVLANYWWDGFSAGPDAPYTSMLLAMIAIAERTAPERAAWRAFFDHYVFRPNGHPLAHLPENQHGILGPLAGGSYGRIRSMVMRLLRGS